jgi:glycerol-3-phosphate acyltransferase PlsY|tara:strand:- start:60 stop:635 length:576 start_codon:yes stop_codon:yes gene_type:complete
MDFLLVFFYSYFLGSIPFGLIITKIFLKKDIRNIGSGNIGTTNVLRTGKKSLAIATLLLDALKGYASVVISLIYFNDLIFLSALICFIGHVFPIWLSFRGGKGVAVYLGIIISLSFPLGIVFGVSWLFIALIFKYSSLSSMVGALAVLLYSILLNNYSLSFFLFTIFIIILFTHRENIRKLKNSEESKIKL